MLGHRLGTITAAAVAALTMGLAACGGDDSSGASTTDPPRTDSPTTTLAPTDQAEADVRAAYDAYWEMSERLAAAPDPNDPEIAERTTGGAQDKLVDSLTTMQAQQQRLEFGPSNEHRVVEVVIDGDGATVTDCVIDEGVRVNTATGERTDFPAVRGLLVTTMELASGDWLVVSITKPPAADVEPVCGA